MFTPKLDYSHVSRNFVWGSVAANSAENARSSKHNNLGSGRINSSEKADRSIVWGTSSTASLGTAIGVPPGGPPREVPPVPPLEVPPVPLLCQFGAILTVSKYTIKLKSTSY
jgi:hypothetical protein